MYKIVPVKNRTELERLDRVWDPLRVPGGFSPGQPHAGGQPKREVPLHHEALLFQQQGDPRSDPLDGVQWKGGLSSLFCWGQWPEATLTGHPSRPPSQRLSVNRDTARESVIQIWETVSSAFRAMMVMIYGCEWGVGGKLWWSPSCFNGHLSIIATAHIRNIWKQNIILKILLLVQNTHCNISTISVNIGFGSLTRKISKEFYLLTESFLYCPT